MMIIIEVAHEAQGMLATKRAVLRSEEFESIEQVEAAALLFIREAKRANEAQLEAGAA